MSTIYPSAKQARNTAIGLLMASLAIAYPCLTVALVKVHYSFRHADLNKQTEAILQVVTFPMCLGCVFALFLLLADARGMKRLAGIGVCATGIGLNILLVLALGFTV
jgi:hypothetical protein